MNLIEEIKRYIPINEQEEMDKQIMLEFMTKHHDFLDRENRIGHFSASAWVVNHERTKVLMIYHNIYDSWSWVGGHADQEENLIEVALRELQEETGVQHAKLISKDIFSLETLTVNGHVRKGIYVPCHLHFNITYLIEADERDELFIKPDENKGVKWFTMEEALKAPKEIWMVEHVYKKLVSRSKL